MNHVVHLINRTPSVVIENRIPYDLLHGKMLDITSLKVFGCLCYVSSLDRNKNKFDPKSRKCMFLGYKQGIKGYIVFDIKTREIFISRNAIFYETVFPYYKREDEASESHDSEIFFNLIIETPRRNYNKINYEADQNNDETDQTNIEENVRRSTRERKILAYLHDYHYSNMNIVNNKVKYPLSSVISYSKLSNRKINYTLALTVVPKPKTYEEAIGSIEWRKAMDREIDALEKNQNLNHHGPSTRQETHWVSGFIKQSTRQMDLQKDTRHVWWQRGTTNLRELTTQRHSLRLQSSLL